MIHNSNQVSDNINVKKLRSFLSSHSTKSEDQYTHTTMGGYPTGKFNISDKENEGFIGTYIRVLRLYKGLKMEPELYVLERPKFVGPLTIDLDFRHIETKRMYTEDNIYTICKKFNDKIKKYFDIDPTRIVCHVLEKKTPILDKNNIVHDGLHIIYPDIPMVAPMRCHIINEVKLEVENENCFQNINLTNKLNDVFDLSIVIRNLWFMYGSRKPNNQAYELTIVYDHDMKKKDLEKYKNETDLDLVTLFSVRRYDQNKSVPLKNEWINNNEFNILVNDQYKKCKTKDKNKEQNKKLQQLPVNDFSCNNNNVQNNNLENCNYPNYNYQNYNYQNYNYPNNNNYQNYNYPNNNYLNNNFNNNHQINFENNNLENSYQYNDPQNNNLQNNYQNNNQNNFEDNNLQNNDFQNYQNNILQYNDFQNYQNNNFQYNDFQNYQNNNFPNNNNQYNNFNNQGFNIIKDINFRNNFQNNQNLSNKKTKQDTDFEIARRLTSILSSERSSDYHTWIRVGWALHNVDNRLFEDFNRFSLKCPSKYNYEKCTEIWSAAKDHGYTIASLHLWAKQDDPQAYTRIMREFTFKIVDSSEIKTHNDVAKLVCDMYHHCFRCTSITSKTWYEFKNHRWIRVDKAYSLSLRIFEEVRRYLMYIGSFYGANAAMYQEGPELDYKSKKGQNIMKLADNLGDQKYKEHILAACAERFYDSEFEKKLDDNVYLIGFDNGVYDLKEGQFRPGVPDDYLTLSVGYNYQEFNESDTIIQEIEDFFRTVQPEEDMRKYVLTLLSSYLDGRNRDQKFILWTGSGCHEKDTKILMYDGSIKYVQNINIGDKLMGDDSKPRIVKQLFHGRENMYKIILDFDTDDKNNEFVVNENHRLALKCLFKDYVSEKQVNGQKIFRLTWHILINNVPEERYVDFTNKESADKLLEYVKPLMIQFNDIIPIHVYNYVEFSKTSISKYYKMFNNLIKFEKQADKLYTYSHDIRTRILNTLIENYGGICSSKHYLNKLTTYNYNLDIYNYEDIKLLILSLGLKYEVKDKLWIYGLDNSDINYNFKIEKLPEDNFYGFEVDGNQRYVLGNFITTYNSNGKSTTIDFTKNALGGYFGSFPVTVITGKRGSSSNATPELADKRGVRFVVIQEPEHDDTIYVGRMKELSGGDWIYARQIYKEGFCFKPQFKLILVCNKLPHIPSNDGGTWRRLRVTPWESEFIDGEPKTPKQFRKDSDLPEKMKKWVPAFMWLLLKKYYPLYCQEGLIEPEKVTLFTNNYKKDQDIYFEFVNDCYDITKIDTDTYKIQDIHYAFNIWYKEAYNTKAPPRKDLCNYLSANYKVVRGTVHGLKPKAQDASNQPLEKM